MQSSENQILQARRLALPICPTAVGRSSGRWDDVPQPRALRDLAADIRQHSLEHLDHYLQQLKSQFVRRGGHYIFAMNAASARAAMQAIAREHRLNTVIAGTGPVIDEIALKPTESAKSIGRLKVIEANFAIAATGQLCICTEDLPGHSGPSADHHQLLVIGMESIVPRLVDLAVLLKVRTRAGGGSAMPASSRLIGPDPGYLGQTHLLVIDNGRRQIWQTPHRPLLRCVGCGACAAVCPVWNNGLGVADSSPIGAAVAPLLAMARSLRPGAARSLPFASTLCGQCADVCPVGIDIPLHLLRLRQQLMQPQHRSVWNRLRGRLRLRWMLKPASFAANSRRIRELFFG